MHMTKHAYGMTADYGAAGSFSWILQLGDLQVKCGHLANGGVTETVRSLDKRAAAAAIGKAKRIYGSFKSDYKCLCSNIKVTMPSCYPRKIMRIDRETVMHCADRQHWNV